ncbi:MULTISPECIES: hypothetical protein [Actinokineospora]|uniref:DUF4352 domain-containing protein n=1 Tax=Actinokineospora fastidiosa TaxID=1816 RepID=A0A918GKK5_9PSEU|nr:MULTISPECIES: hypothetical protein [Actinokineospora]UVS77460.1 hypothetical protein Actkin_01170 [Actinokineospora sp. UTMC 2448]GGS43157.1 hypothetical protein GCM10010171_42780 [Actinokineospora fastidiosa]
MQTARRAAAACALLAALAGCGAAQSSTPPPEQLAPSVERAEPPGSTTQGGALTALGRGLSIAVSAPKSFVPTSSASPAAARAVGFEMTVRNDGDTPYRPTLLALTAHVDSQAVKQVVDSTQGYSGLVGTEEIAPGQSMRFSVAFAVPPEKADVRVVAKPDPAAAVAVTVFDGEV